MSVAILTDIFKIVEIPDDLESFLYVLLYYAIRYLRSNCDDVGDWIEAFFDSYTLSRDGSYTCGEKKATTLKYFGELRTGSSKLTFGEPMDELFDSLFQSFKAYYAVKLYDSMSQALPSAPSHGPSNAPMTSGLAPSLDYTPITVDYQLKKKTKVTRRNNHYYAPSELDREQAENVADHDGMLALLIDLTNKTGWPLDDKVGDRVPKDWTSKLPFGLSIASAAAVKKRMRVASQTPSAEVIIESSMESPGTGLMSSQPSSSKLSGRRGHGGRKGR